MKNNLDIDQLIKEGMANFEPTPPADAWSFIEKQIQVPPTPGVQGGNSLVKAIKQVGIGGKIAAVAGVSLVSLGLYFGLNQKQVEIIDLPQQENTVQKEALKQETILVPETVVAGEGKINIKKQVSESKVEIEASSNQINSELNQPAQNPSSDKALDQTEPPVKASAKDIENKKKEDIPVVGKIDRNTPSTENSNAKQSNDVELIIPNAFSPDGDGKNDTWVVQIDQIANYHLTILDGNGEVVFESNQINNAWNGANMKTGVDCASGSYAYLIDYQLNDEKEQRTKRGIISLFR